MGCNVNLCPQNGRIFVVANYYDSISFGSQFRNYVYYVKEEAPVTKLKYKSVLW